MFKWRCRSKSLSFDDLLICVFSQVFQLSYFNIARRSSFIVDFHIFQHFYCLPKCFNILFDIIYVFILLDDCRVTISYISFCISIDICILVYDLFPIFNLRNWFLFNFFYLFVLFKFKLLL